MTLNPQLREILVCPKCKGPLTDTDTDTADGAGLDCPSCQLRYPIRDDIPVMLVDEATPLG